MKRTAGRRSLAALPAGGPSADITGFFQFRADLREIFFALSDVQSNLNRPKMIDFGLCVADPLRQCFVSSLEFVVLFKAVLRVLLRGKLRVERNLYCFPFVVVIRADQFLCALLQSVSVCLNQLAAHAVALAFFCVLQLFPLQFVFPFIPLQHRLNLMAQFRGALVNPGRCVFLGIVSLQHLTHRRKFPLGQIRTDGHGKSGKFSRYSVLIDDPGRKIAVFYVIHHQREGMVQMENFRLLESLHRTICIDSGPRRNFLSHKRADAGQGLIQRLCDRKRLCGHFADKCRFTDGERIEFVRGVCNKVGTAGQYLTDGTDASRNAANAVDDCSFSVCEDDVAVLSHQLHDEVMFRKIPHLVEVFRADMNNTLQTRLRYRKDASVPHVLAQQHAEIRCCGRRGFLLAGEVHQGKTGACTDHQPAGLFSLLHGQDELVAFRLGDTADSAAGQFLIHFPDQTGDGDSVKCHLCRSF